MNAEKHIKSISRDYERERRHAGRQRGPLYDKLIHCVQEGKLSEWNKWVDEIVKKYKAGLASGETCDIPEINLGGADLAKQDLKGIKLLFVHLEGADLRKAHLNGANFTGVGLSELRVDPKQHTQPRMSEEDTTTGSNGPFDQEQYERILSCEKNGDFSKWNEWIQKKRDERTQWEILTYGRSEVYGIIKLAGADLTNLNLKGFDLMFAHLEGAIIHNAKLLGTDCSHAVVNGRTFITTDCDKINDKTDFTGVGLSRLRIDPELHTRLLRNIRKKQWEKWYAEKQILTFFKRHGFFKWMDEVSHLGCGNQRLVMGQ